MLISLLLFFRSKQNFYTIIDLPEGEYQYKFIVDGQWKLGKNQVLLHYIYIATIIRTSSFFLVLNCQFKNLNLIFGDKTVSIVVFVYYIIYIYALALCLPSPSFCYCYRSLQLLIRYHAYLSQFAFGKPDFDFLPSPIVMECVHSSIL